MASAVRVQQAEWVKPVRQDWVARVADEINFALKPVVLVAHSLGVAAAIHALAEKPELTQKVKGAFLVAPPDVENPDIRPRHLMTFGPYPRDPLPFASFVVASRTDPFSSYEKAEETAAGWGSFLVDAGDSGHINAESGHGPWPEGLMVFAELMKRL